MCFLILPCTQLFSNQSVNLLASSGKCDFNALNLLEFHHTMQIHNALLNWSLNHCYIHGQSSPQNLAFDLSYIPFFSHWNGSFPDLSIQNSNTPHFNLLELLFGEFLDFRDFDLLRCQCSDYGIWDCGFEELWLTPLIK
jgi:hypothetical protein